jgi:PEGA domain-containing protein
MRCLARLRTAPLLAAVIAVMAGPWLASIAVEAQGGRRGAEAGRNAAPAHDHAAPGHEPAVPLRGGATLFGAVPPLPVAHDLYATPPPSRPVGSAGSINSVRSSRSVRNGRHSVVIVPPAFGWYGGFYPADAGSAVYPPPVAPRSSNESYPLTPEWPAVPYPQPPPSKAWLELQLAPDSAQVYIDGFYAGTVSDFSRSGGAAAEPGPHRIEIREAGYQPATFDVRLTPDQTVTYREDLRPLNGVTPPRNAPAVRKAPATTTFYVIADCYAGNVPPSEAALRPGCDPAQVKTIVIRH